MQYALVYGAQTALLNPYIVSIETDLSRGLHAFTLVGLPDKAVEESRDRVSSAIKHAGFDSPKTRNQKIVISLSPASIKKEGPSLDLPIALSYLLAAGDIRFNPAHYVFVGELSLDGRLLPIRGVLPLVAEAKRAGMQAIFVPIQNAREAALVDGIIVYGAESLRTIIEHIDEHKERKVKGAETVEKVRRKIVPTPQTQLMPESGESQFPFEDIRGQEYGKRAAVIAAAGGHNLGLYGPPGTGKTMLARAIAAILPPLTFDEVLEVNSIHSVAGTLSSVSGGLMTSAPFRSPHHTASYVSIVGGGSTPRPGEATLAHRGVLFLDEFPEFERKVIESLRQPLEDRVISVARAKGTAVFPAEFMLVAAMNPCPCGNYGHPKIECACTQASLERYRRRISGPIADRIDLWSSLGPVELSELGKRDYAGVSTHEARELVACARNIQKKRNTQTNLKTKSIVANDKSGDETRVIKSKLNSELSARDIHTYAPLTPEVRATLETAGTRLNLSPRAYHRVIKVARTIADLESCEHIALPHILEALQYRERKT